MHLHVTVPRSLRPTEQDFLIVRFVLTTVAVFYLRSNCNCFVYVVCLIYMYIVVYVILMCYRCRAFDKPN